MLLRVPLRVPSLKLSSDFEASSDVNEYIWNQLVAAFNTGKYNKITNLDAFVIVENYSQFGHLTIRTLCSSDLTNRPRSELHNVRIGHRNVRIDKGLNGPISELIITHDNNQRLQWQPSGSSHNNYCAHLRVAQLLLKPPK